MGSYQDGPELHEVAVGRVFHCEQERCVSACIAPVTGAGRKRAIFTFHDAPRVEPPSDPLTSCFHHSVAANHSEGDAVLHQQTREEEEAFTALLELEFFTFKTQKSASSLAF